MHVIMREMEVVEHAFAALGPSLPAIDKLADLLRGAVARRIALWGWGHAVPHQIVMRHAGYLALRRRLGERLAALLDDGKHEGSIASDVPTPVLARMIQHWFSADLSAIVRGGGVPVAELPAVVVRVILGGVRVLGE